jgi:hypothetical protein
MHNVSSRSARQRLLRGAKVVEFSDDTIEVGVLDEEAPAGSLRAPVRAPGGHAFVTDGPFAETKELIGSPRWR